MSNFLVSLYLNLCFAGFSATASAEILSEFDSVDSLAPYSVTTENRVHIEHIDTMDVHPTKPHLILTNAYDGFVRLTDTTDPRNWKLVWEWRKPQQALLAELPIKFNKNGTLIGFGDYKGRGYVFDSKDGTVVFNQFIGETGDPEYNHIFDVYFSDDGESVFFSRQQKIFEYEIKTGKLIFVYQGPFNASLRAVTLLNDGRLFASNYGTSYVWDRGERTSTELARFPIVLWTNNQIDTTVLKNQWHTVQAGFDLFLLDFTTKEIAQKFIAASAPMSAFKFVRNDSVLVSCTHFGELAFHETRTGKVLAQYQMVNHDTNEPTGCHTFSSSPDGSILYFTSGRGHIRKMTNF